MSRRPQPLSAGSATLPPRDVSLERSAIAPAGLAPFLGDRAKKYARKHVPFLSFREVQNKGFQNVVGVDTHAKDNAFVTDIGSFIADPQKHRLPEYMFYSPNLDDDGHDPTSNSQEGLKKASDWLCIFLTTWLHFDDTTWLPKDEQMKRTLVTITFDGSEGNNEPALLTTTTSVLRTIEDNFGLDPIHKDSGDVIPATAS